MPKHILVVDDDVSILEAVQILLEDSGYRVSALNVAADTLSEATTLRPDLILLDLLMSGADGRDVVRQLKANQKTKNIPVVLMSADTYIKEKSSEVPVATFIKKPFDIEELEAIIKSFCK